MTIDHSSSPRKRIAKRMGSIVHLFRNQTTWHIMVSHVHKICHVILFRPSGIPPISSSTIPPNYSAHSHVVLVPCQYISSLFPLQKTLPPPHKRLQMSDMLHRIIPPDTHTHTRTPLKLARVNAPSPGVSETLSKNWRTFTMKRAKFKKSRHSFARF